MKKLLYFVFTIMTMMANAQTKDPSGQNRYFKLGEKNTLSVFESPAYDFSDNFFDGYAEATIAELSLTGWKAWNEFGDHAELVAVTGTSKVLFKNGAQWVECYLVGCKKGGKLYYNRLRFIDKKIVEAGPAPAPKVDPIPAPKAADPAPTANADQRLQDFKDGLLTGSLIAKSNNNCCCCGTQTTTTTLPQTTYPQIVLPQTTYPQQVIYPQQQQVVFQQPRGERIVNGIVRVLDAIVPDNLSINVNQSTSVISNSGNTQYSYPTTQTQYPQINTQPQNRCADGSMPVLWTYQDGSTQYICGGVGNTTNPGNGTVITQQPQLPGNTNEPGSGQTPPIIIKPGNTNDPAFQAGIGMNNLRTVNNQTQGLNSNGSFMNQNQNQGLTSNGAFASGLQN